MTPMRFMEGVNNFMQCPICSIEYADEGCIPKVLNCGHTFCIKCISGLIMDLKMCPMCSESVAGPIHNFPTNYALLEVENENKVSIEDLELKKKEIGDTLKEERMLLDKNFTIMKNSQEMLNSYLETVKKWNDMKIDNHLEYQNMIKDMEEKLRDLDFNLYSCYKPYIKADFSLRYEKNKEDFMVKVVVELLRGNNLYAFNSEWYNDEIYWGKLSYDGRKIYIHSFTSDLPPMKSFLVPLIDLKDCIGQYGFQTFIDIPGNRIFCNIVSPCKLSHDFIKLCSGEDGTSFKGLTTAIKPFTNKREETMILKIKMPRKDSEQGYDVLDSLLSETKEASEDRFHIKMWDEKCEIVKYPKLQSSKKIESDGGVIVASAESSADSFLYPYNSNDDGPCVEDCGLILVLSTEPLDDDNSNNNQKN